MGLNVFISQREHFQNKLELILRSSAIFYCKKSPSFKTTISFMNYWKQKRDLDVTVVSSIRDMDGTLIYRKELLFNGGMVINYTPELEQSEFEGSIEIEVFSIKNLVIPYAAVMAVYESENGISMVHSYSRTYYPHEIEDKRTITKGEESCWTIRDSDDIKSFCVFHNGGRTQSEQIMTLRVLGPDNDVRTAEIPLPSIPPYGTVKFFPSDHIQGLSEWLGSGIGNANISFVVDSAFTRILVGNERIDGTDLQITHSNFNYSKHKTDVVDDKDATAYMNIPDCDIEKKYVVVYPDSESGEYEYSYLGRQQNFKSGEQVVIPVTSDVIEFKRHGGFLPTRLVTGIVTENENGYLPAETSMGVVHYLRPPKRLWWAICANDDYHSSRLIIHDVPQVYEHQEFNIFVRLYSASSGEFIEYEISNAQNRSEECSKGLNLSELFPGSKTFLSGEFGYVTIYSEYGGLYCYTLIENTIGSHTLEHGF